MADEQAHDIVRDIADTYLASFDFNGVPIRGLCEHLRTDAAGVISALTGPIMRGEIGVVFLEDEGNPHILRFGIREPEEQISRLPAGFEWACAYPRPSVLEKIVDRSKYEGEPYKLALALGEGQFVFRMFDLRVLEAYRNDPRYMYVSDDVQLYICIRDEHFQTGAVAERDEILIQNIGFAFDDAMNRVAAAPLRYLYRLSPEHQQIWRASELTGDYKLHPDYYDSVILGNWRENEPIHDAFLFELRLINEMSAAMGRESLFRRDYGRNLDDKPRKFCFLLRPTLGEFNAYVLLLDQLLSDNINAKFFRDDVPREEEITRGDGKIVVQPKGTIRLLDEWARKFFRFDDPKPWEAAIAAMKRVRKLRQSPAHAVNEDRFDQQFVKDQRALIGEAYGAVRTVRQMLARHPSVRAASIDVPDVICEGKIVDF